MISVKASNSHYLVLEEFIRKASISLGEPYYTPHHVDSSTASCEDCQAFTNYCENYCGFSLATL